MVNETEIKQRYMLLTSQLDEKTCRLYLAAEAEVIGYGGQSTVSRATGASRETIREA